MRTVSLLVTCLVFASVVRASEIKDEDPTVIVDGNPVPTDAPAKDTKRQEDELLEEKGNEEPLAKTTGDEKAPAKRNDKKNLVNGEDLKSEDLEEESTVIVDGVPSGSAEDEMDEPSEDSGPWVWKKHPYSWCTIRGRKFLSGRKGVPQTFEQCASECNKTRGCHAIEMWFAYNWNCYWCTKPELIRPYTNKRDLAYPVHVWTRVKKPPPAVNVTCEQNEMSISLPKYLLKGLDREHLRLRDLSCGATETSTHFILSTNLTGCDTVKRHTKGFVCYMNKVEEIPIKPGQIITRIREVEIPFACYYSNMGVVSAVGLQVKSKKIVFSEKGFGKFVLALDIFPTPRFELPYKKKDFPIVVPLRKILYVKVSVDTEDERLRVLAVDCWATPDPNPFSRGLRYDLIKDGCAVDNTVMDIRTLDKRMQKFKFEAFSFIGDNQFVYLHCKVLICNATDPNSRCEQGCVQRKKRAVATQVSKDEEVHVSQGPFMRGDDEEETKVEETLRDMSDTEKSGTFPTLVAAMAVVAAVCVMGVSYFAWNSRKRGTVRDYQRLTVTAED